MSNIILTYYGYGSDKNNWRGGTGSECMSYSFGEGVASGGGNWLGTYLSMDELEGLLYEYGDGSRDGSGASYGDGNENGKGSGYGYRDIDSA